MPTDNLFILNHWFLKQKKKIEIKQLNSLLMWNFRLY